MPSVVTDAIVLHAFDYLESSRILRILTRDAGLRSALAKGARASRRRFGSGLDLFAQGTAHLYAKAGRDLDTLSAFEDVMSRGQLAQNLERFAGAEMIAEIVLRLGADGESADAALFDVVADTLDALASANPCDARDRALAGAWRVISALGVEPSLLVCAECDTPIGDDETVAFSYAAGGVLCPRCAVTAISDRTLPADARRTLAGWLAGHPASGLGDAASRAHQRLLREFIAYHLHDNGGRSLRAFELWERDSWGVAAVPAPSPRTPNPDSL